MKPNKTFIERTNQLNVYTVHNVTYTYYKFGVDFLRENINNNMQDTWKWGEKNLFTDKR